MTVETTAVPAILRNHIFILRRYWASLTSSAVLVVPAAGALAQTLSGDGFVATSAVAAVVRVPTPWYAPKAAVWSKMRDTIPQYENIAGRSFKAYSIAQADGRCGGIYLWKDLASARAWFNPAWF